MLISLYRTIWKGHVCIVKDKLPQKLLHAIGLKEPNMHTRKAETRKQAEWYRNECLNGETSLDPHVFHVLEVHNRLRDTFRDAFPEFSAEGGIR